MSRRTSSSQRSVFPVLDDGLIGILHTHDADDGLDDALARHDPAELHIGSFLGNFTARRIRIVGIGLMMVFGVLVARVGMWQIVDGESYRLIADRNRTRTKVIIPDRGVLFDRNGQLLAWNTPNFRAIAVWEDFSDDTLLRAKQCAEIAILLGVAPEDCDKRYRMANGQATFVLADDIPYAAAMAYLAEHGNDARITVELASERSYITHAIPTLSHVLGFTGAITPDEYEVVKTEGYRRFDTMGKIGLEAQYESVLRGTPGVDVVEVDSQGRPLRTLEKTDAINGTNITLSLDAGFTAAIEQILSEHLQNADIKRAAVVVTNPQNGEVLALVSYPSYDANLFSHGISQDAYRALVDDDNAPLFPRATQGEYPSGSTIKPVYAAAALMEGIITPQTSFLSTGGVWAGNRFFPDWRKAGHGPTNVYHAIADSVNTFFYVIGGGTGDFQGLGRDRLQEYANRFGFGFPSGIDLPNEADGFFPTETWKQEVKGERWYIGDTYNVAIGQGDFLATPIQINRSTATFANGGMLISPHLVKDFDSEMTRIVPKDIATVIRDAMRETVRSGSATIMRDLAEPVAGKTGTAQWATGKAEHTWFTGFGPFDNPQIAVTVLVEQGGNAYFTTPIAKDIFAWWFANRFTQEIDPHSGT
jgi:penicillin-binding protein 2